MFNWLESLKARREAQLRGLAEQSEREEQKALAEVERLVRAMTSKHCPISGGMCVKSCVHFYSGGVYSLPRYSEPGVEWMRVLPRCKLWGRTK